MDARRSRTRTAAPRRAGWSAQLAALSWIVACVSWIGLARAEPSEARARAEARAEFQRGTELATASRFAEAANAFERANALFPHADTLYNLAQAYLSMGTAPAALAALERYLEASAAEDPKRARADLQRNELASRVATLVLRVDPAPAAIALDGQPLARDALERPLLLEPGGHRIEASSPSYAPARTVIELRAGSRTELSLTLERTPPSTPKAGPAAAGLAADPPRAPDRALPRGALEVDAGRERAADRQRAWGLALAGGGAVLGAVTAALLIDNHARFSRYEAERAAIAELPADDPQRPGRLADNERRNDKAQVIDRVSAGTGTASVLLLIAGAAMYLAPPFFEPAEVGVGAGYGVSVRARW